MGNVLRDDFDQNSANALTIAMPNMGGSSPAQLSAYAAQLSLVKGAAGVVSPEGTFVSGRRADGLSTPVVGSSTYFTLQNNANPNSSAGQQLVRAVRDVPAPAGPS